MTTPAPLFAFASGSLTYECQPCGRCCRGLGLAEARSRVVSNGDLPPLAPYVDATTLDSALVNFFTFADGCRYQGDDNLCDIHRARGRGAKPRLCRLFPFSKLVSVDELWVVLPHEGCPWRARPGPAPDPVSDHAAILTDLDAEVLSGVIPRRLQPVTRLGATARRALEEAITGELDLDAEPHQALERVAAIQGEHVGSVVPLPADDSLWLDLLRCAGPPAPLSAASGRTFIAAIVAMRIGLVDRLPLEAIPSALVAFELWLRTLAELVPRDLSGEDLLRLLLQSVPLARLLAFAEQPIPPLIDDPSALPPHIQAMWRELARHAGEPLGTTLLRFFRIFDRGPLTMLTQLGEAYPALVRTERLS